VGIRRPTRRRHPLQNVSKFQSKGFINTVSDVLEFCDMHGLDDVVVNGTWFQRSDMFSYPYA
jgi:hypothetical protein